MRRLWLHIVTPVVLFGVACYAAFHIPNVYWNQLLSTVLIAMMVLYLILQC